MNLVACVRRERIESHMRTRSAREISFLRQHRRAGPSLLSKRPNCTTSRLFLRPDCAVELSAAGHSCAHQVTAGAAAATAHRTCARSSFVYFRPAEVAPTRPCPPPAHTFPSERQQLLRRSRRDERRPDDDAQQLARAHDIPSSPPLHPHA